MKELERMQTVDLARRRQIVARMPPQLFEAGYRRLEIKEEWQRDMECAFEDMYTGERSKNGLQRSFSNSVLRYLGILWVDLEHFGLGYASLV